MTKRITAKEYDNRKKMREFRRMYYDPEVERQLDALRKSLNIFSESGTFESRQAIAEQIVNTKKERLKKVLDLKKIKEMKDGRKYIHIGTKLAAVTGSEMYTAPNEKLLIEKLYDAFFGSAKMTLKEAYKKYQRYRKDLGLVTYKTIAEDMYNWKKLETTHIAEMCVKDIRIRDIKMCYAELVKGGDMTERQLKNIRSTLNGIFTYCVSEMEIIPHNFILEIKLDMYRGRLKRRRPKLDYTLDEIKRLKQELSGSEDVYDLAVRFALTTFLRIGEIIALTPQDLMYSELEGYYLNVDKSRHVEREIVFDGKGNVVLGKTEHRVTDIVKGNSEMSQRGVPLSDEGVEIFQKAVMMHPENEYVFMHDGHVINTTIFNRHLRAACEKLNIPYRSSHQIRFTNAYRLYAGGVPLPELSRMMGHTTLTMTMHYLRQRRFTPEIAAEVRKILTA